MELRDRVIVVTGGGSGIGAALALRLAAESPAAIVLADLDGDHVRAVAEQVAAANPDVTVEHRTCDVSSSEEVERLVAQTSSEHGRVDLYCSNAGIGTGAGIDAPDEVWQRIPGSKAWRLYQNHFDMIWNSNYYSNPKYAFYQHSSTPIHARMQQFNPDALLITGEDLED